GKPKLPADQQSTIARLRSVTPRLRMAACQRGSARTAASQSTNSSSTMAGWAPGTCSHARTRPSESDTTASYVWPGPESMSTTKAARSTASPGRCASTTFLAGSCSMMKMARTRGPSERSVRTISHARSISAALSGSRGWTVDAMRGLLGGLLDDLVGPGQDGARHRQPDRARGLEVDGELEPVHLLDGQVTRPGALQEPVDVGGGAALGLREARGIAQEAARLDRLLEREDRGQSVLPGDLGDLRCDPVDHGALYGVDPLHLAGPDPAPERIEHLGARDLHPLDAHTDARADALELPEVGAPRIDHDGEPRELRHHLLEQREALAPDLGAEERDPGNVAVRPGQIRHQPLGDRVSGRSHDDRDALRYPLGREGRL